MRVKSRVLTPFIAKKVEGIFGYDILLYGFLFRRQWESFPQSFARIGALFIKWRRVEHKATRAGGLSRFVQFRILYSDIFFLANIPYFNFHINFQSSYLTKKETEDASKRLFYYWTEALNYKIELTLTWRTPKFNIV